ncbi:MAG TPA: polysaccharide deacetylase family protein [Firmicutes bacterium]|nr:polysaccharide deacetylase family protein [Bacillota bacterium]
MTTFFMLIICSFLAGIAISYVPLYRQSKYRLEVDFVKGAAVALVTLFLVGTPMALLAAGCGLLTATRWFPYPRGHDRKIYGMATGLLLFMAPDLFLVLLLWCLLLGFLQCSFHEELLSSYFLILPLLMFFTDKSDVYILFSLVLFVIVLLDNFERLEMGMSHLFGPVGKKINHGATMGLGGAGYTLSQGEIGSELPSGRQQELNTRLASKLPAWFRSLRRPAYVLAVFLLFFAFFLNRYVYRGFGMQIELFRKGPPEAHVVALTFDDGPDPRFTPDILDILAEEDVKATFFMVGKHVEKYPHIAQQVLEAGHEIGNHTYSHANLLQAPLGRITTEIERGEKAIFNATGLRPSLFRPPRGLYEAKLMEETKERGYTITLWSLSSNDWLEMRPVDISRTILQNVTPGDIILFHDSGNLIRAEGGERLPTVRSLKTVISGLKEQGYDFVTVTELLILSGLSGDQ